MTAHRPPAAMTLDELFAVGNDINETNAACGVPREGREYMLDSWIDGLVTYCGVAPVVADALARRWMIRPRWNQPASGQPE